MPAKLYDWDEWFGSGRFMLVKGRDYRCGQAAMAQQIRTAAARRGLSISLVEGDRRFTVTVVGDKNHAKAI